MKKIVLIIAIQLIAIRVIGSELKNEHQMIIETVYSESLKEGRMISVYLPPDYDENKEYPVIFATDGQLLDSLYRRSLDSLINKSQLPELIMIGSFSNEKKVDGTEFTYRNYEYIKHYID